MPKIVKLILVALFTGIINSVYSLDFIIPDNLSNKVSFVISDPQSQNIIYSYRESAPQLIASNMKIVTSYVAIQQLGESFNWTTKLTYQGKIKHGVLYGNLYLIGSGDPTLNSQKISQALTKIKQRGIHKIMGNLVIDSSVFNQIATSSELSPEPLAKYSVEPNGLIIDDNLSQIKLKIHKHKVILQPQENALDAKYVNQLRLDTANKSNCDDPSDYITATKNESNVILQGRIPSSCNNQNYSIYLAKPFNYNSRIISKLLKQQQIKLSGSIIAKKAPQDVITIENISSANLYQVLQHMNQTSDNLEAKTLLLSLGAYKTSNQATYQQSKELYLATLAQKFDFPELANLENGAGLSRYEKLSAGHINQLLTAIYQSPESNAFINTLPTPAQKNTTLQSSFTQYAKQLYVKTGSLSDTQAYSGYFKVQNGKTYVVVALANQIESGVQGKSELRQFKNLFSQILDELNHIQ